MASTNQSPFYQAAEKKFLTAQTTEEKLIYLGEMIRECPKHKSAENMLRNLKLRYKKLKNSLEKSRKAGKGKKQGIKKADMQAILLGFSNTGKSSLFNLLTSKKSGSKISPHPFTTYEPKLGTMIFEDAKIQLIDMPPFPNEDKSILDSADTILIVVDTIEQIKKSLEHEHIKNAGAKKLLIFNKADTLSENEKRKISSTLKSKFKSFEPTLLTSITPSNQNVEQLKQKIFQTFPIIRVYTKEPHKPATKEPMIMKQNSTLKDAAEKILKGMSQKIKRVRIWGPSSKFSGQVIGLEHVLKDKDTIEFQVK